MTYRELAIWQDEDGQIQHKTFLTISSFVGFRENLLKNTPYDQVWNLNTDGDWHINKKDSYTIVHIETENIPPHIKLYALMLGNWSES